LVISALAVVMGLSVGLIHLLMRLDRVARDHLAQATTRNRLAHRFRLDVRTAARARPGPQGAGRADGLELTGPGGRVVTYGVRDGRLVRAEHDGSRLVRQEAY